MADETTTEEKPELYSDKAFELYKKVLETTTGDGTPFAKSQAFIAENVDKMILKEEDRVEFLSKFFVDTTVGLTNNSMSQTITILDREAKLELERQNLESTIDARKKHLEADIAIKTANKQLLEKQTSKVAADILSLGRRDANLDKQVRHNALIHWLGKYASYLDSIGKNQVPDTVMHKNFLLHSKLLSMEAGVTFEGTKMKVDDPNTEEKDQIELGDFKTDVSPTAVPTT